MDVLTLEAGRWYALQQLGSVESSASWEAATPVLITGVTPLKTGRGIIQLELVRLFAELGPTSERLTLEIAYRGADVVIAVGTGWLVAPMTVAITIIDMEWLSRFCPRLLQRYGPFDYLLSGPDGEVAAEAFLAYHFGETTDQLLANTVAPAAEKLGSMPVEHGSVSFARSYTGLDAWLMLRPVVAPDMDFKWLIVAFSGRDNEFVIRFHRSWTGVIIYELPLTFDGTRLESTKALVNLNKRDYAFGAPEAEAAFLDWLINSWLLGSSCDMPRLGSQDRERTRQAWADHFASLGLFPPRWLSTTTVPNEECH